MQNKNLFRQHAYLYDILIEISLQANNYCGDMIEKRDQYEVWSGRFRQLRKSLPYQTTTL